MSRHGGSGTWYAQGCRCEYCTQAHAIRIARRTAQRTAMNKDENDPRHGTHSFYRNWGCRCDRCRAAGREQNAKNYAKRKAAVA